MNKGDLVRINLPDRARGREMYYYHGYVAVVINAQKSLSSLSNDWMVEVLVDNIERKISRKYLEKIT